MGERTLTSGEVNAWEASLGQVEVPQEARNAYIRNWIEKELLYQAALDRELGDDPWAAEKIESLTREVLVARLLDLEYADAPRPTLAEISAYFQEHSSEFVWAHEHRVVDYWRSSDAAAMNTLRSNLLRGRQTGIWTGQAGGLENGRIAIDGPSDAAPEVWRVVSRLRSGEVSQVSSIHDAWWIFKVLEIRNQGDPQVIDDVRDDIETRLYEDSRRRLRDELIRKVFDKQRRSGKLQWAHATDLPQAVSAVKDTVSNTP